MRKEIEGQMTIFDMLASAPEKKEYAEYLFEIKKELMILGVHETTAVKKAKSCCGLYTNKTKFLPVREAVKFCLKRIPLYEFSLEGLETIRDDFHVREDEITLFINQQKCGLKDRELKKLQWGTVA